jgi:enoyl-CoA hydratase/carnithine racemase
MSTQNVPAGSSREDEADAPVLRDRLDDGVVVLTINRPDVLNACSAQVSSLLERFLQEVEADRDARCVILTGARDRAFSAGNDIWEMVDLNHAANAALQKSREDLNWRWATLRVPTIAALNGLAAGYGTILAVSADLRVGGPQSTMTVTASSYGGANLTWNLPSLIGWSHAKDLLLTGRTVAADELLSIGLLNRFASTGSVLAAAVQLAQEIVSNPPQGVAIAKALIHGAPGRTLRERFDSELAAMDPVRQESASALFSDFVGTRRPSATDETADGEGSSA